MYLLKDPKVRSEIPEFKFVEYCIPFRGEYKVWMIPKPFAVEGSINIWTRWISTQTKLLKHDVWEPEVSVRVGVEIVVSELHVAGGRYIKPVLGLHITSCHRSFQMKHVNHLNYIELHHLCYNRKAITSVAWFSAPETISHDYKN